LDTAHVNDRYDIEGSAIAQRSMEWRSRTKALPFSWGIISRDNANQFVMLCRVRLHFVFAFDDQISTVWELLWPNRTILLIQGTKNEQEQYCQVEEVVTISTTMMTLRW